MRDVVDMPWIQPYFIKKNTAGTRCRVAAGVAAPCPSAPSPARYVIGNKNL
jgi:hypothetical protein